MTLGGHLLISCALRKQSISMELLLIISLILSVVRSTTSQVYVTSSSYDGNTRPPALRHTNQTQENLQLHHSIGSNDVPDQAKDSRPERKIVDIVETVDKNKETDTINRQTDALKFTVRDTSTKPLKMHMKVDFTSQPLLPTNRTNGKRKQNQSVTGKTVTTVAVQNNGEYSEKQATFSPIKQDSDITTISRAQIVPPKGNADTAKEDWSMSTITSMDKSSNDYDDDHVQRSHTTKSPMVADSMDMSGAAQGAKQVSISATGHQSKESLSSPLHNATTTQIYTNMRTQPQGETSVYFITPQPKNTRQLASTTTTSNLKSSQKAPSTKSSQQTEEIKPSENTTKEPSTADTTTSDSTTLSPQMGRGRLLPVDNDAGQKEHSLSLGNIPLDNPGPTPSSNSCAHGLGFCSSPKAPNKVSENTTPNRTLLVWADLSRTLSFAWELHVFGSAALFLLLAAGSALGLALAPGMHCPHRGALALANSLLLLTGAIRAIYFLVDPYGSRVLLPLSVVTALYTLPLPLLIWVHASMVALVLKGAKMVLLPPALQHPPLLAVIAVLQCTLLLAADLLSPALSPAVPVVLQTLTLTTGLVLCLGCIFLILPRLSNIQVDQIRDKGLGRSKISVLIRVLAGCSLLGAVCCLMHAYTCFWLYGLLGDWRHFRWPWWLVQFWARLLELTWAFCLLLLSSWVFWRPCGGQMGRVSGQRVSAAGDIALPCPSSSSSETHTCWAKIVQSLKGRPCRKSDSNGMGGASGGGGAGEMPNNWAGQERSGADISKSLIRNRDPPKESNHRRNQRSTEGSSGSLSRLHAFSRTRQCSLSSSLDREKESAISLYDFDLRPPSPIDLTRSIDKALHREHLLRGGSLFRLLGPPSPPPSPETWLRRNSDPQIMISESSDEHTMLTESSADLNRSIPSTVPSRQVTAPPTPTHQGPRWISQACVPSSLSCPITLHHSPSMGRALSPSTDNTRLFHTPDLDKLGTENDAERSYPRVCHHDDSSSVTSDIINL